MIKFAYIVKMPDLTPENYHGVYDNAESHNEIVGVHTMEMAEDVIRKYVADGYTLFNMCSAFKADNLADFKAIAGDDVRMAAVSYIDSEKAKLKDTSKYGVIVQMAGVEESVTLEVNGPGFESRITFVKDMEAAKAAALDHVNNGVTFMEICSWFKADMVDEIIATIDGKIPVGSAGY